MDIISVVRKYVKLFQSTVQELIKQEPVLAVLLVSKYIALTASRQSPFKTVK